MKGDHRRLGTKVQTELNKSGGADVQFGVLRRIRELDRAKLALWNGQRCGRIQDLYFNDESWKIEFLVVAIELRQFGRKLALVSPSQVAEVSKDGVIQLNFGAEGLENLPLASSVLPVCKQYASLALGSPGSSFAIKGLKADPHLRSAKAVFEYDVNIQGETAGKLADFLFDDECWEVRYLAVHERFEGKQLQFHLLPQSVERFTWATRRVVLRELQPVALEVDQLPVGLEQVA